MHDFKPKKSSVWWQLVFWNQPSSGHSRNWSAEHFFIGFLFQPWRLPLVINVMLVILRHAQTVMIIQQPTVVSQENRLVTLLSNVGCKIPSALCSIFYYTLETICNLSTLFILYSFLTCEYFVCICNFGYCVFSINVQITIHKIPMYIFYGCRSQRAPETLNQKMAEN